MNEKLNEFLNEVCGRIRYKKIHGEIREELTAHILENAENSDISVEEAILRMGDSVEIGERLNKEHRPQTEWSIIALGAIIALFGGVIMYTSSKFDEWYGVDFGKYLSCAAVGLIALVFFYFFDYTKLKKLSLPIYFTTLVLFFAMQIFVGNGYYNVRFIRIGAFYISNEYLMFFFVLAFAGFIEKYRGRGGSAIVKFIIWGGVSLIPPVLINSLSLTIVMIICYAALTFTAVMRNHFAGSKKRQLISLGGLGLGGIGIIAFYILNEGYLSRRILSFLSRGQNDPLGDGWQQRMADKVLVSSKLLGETDAGNGWETYLPAAVSDHILVNVIATFGWIVGIALIAVVALFITRMFMTVRKVKADYGFYLSLSACIMLSAQFILSILINFGLFPITSIAMPFISYGQTGYVLSMALVGIILSVWRRNNLVSSTKTPVQIKIKVRERVKWIEFRDGKLIIDFNKYLD